MELRDLFIKEPPTTEVLMRCLKEHPSEYATAGMVPWVCGYYKDKQPTIMILHSTDPEILYENVSDLLYGFRIIGHVVRSNT